METEIMKDVPYTDPITPEPLEQYEKIFDSPSIMHDGFFLALDSGRYVGTSTLWRSTTDEGHLYTGLTGVLRSHRRRGVATALKTVALTFAKESGYKIIETDNEENNPMYLLNLQLGFKPQPAYLDYHRPIEESDLQPGQETEVSEAA
jgi:GNAT superfamily N-acetyltransferase